MIIRRKSLRPVLVAGLGMGLAASLAAEEAGPGFKWLGLRAGTLFFDPTGNADTVAPVGAQGGMVFEGQDYGFSVEGSQYTSKSSLFPGLKLRYSSASVTFLSSLSHDPAGPFWPYVGLGLDTLSVPEVDPLTFAQTSTRGSGTHVSLGFLQRPGDLLIWGLEGRLVSRFPLKSLQEIQATFFLGFTWGGRSSASSVDKPVLPQEAVAPSQPIVPPVMTAPPSDPTPSDQSQASPGASANPMARLASSPDPASGPSLAPSSDALAPAPMPPAIAPPAPPMPESAPAPVPAMSMAAPAEPAPATSPATGRTEGVSARPMARLASRPDPASGPSLAPSPAALAPAPMPTAIMSPASPMPEPAPAPVPAMSVAAPAEPAPATSTAAGRTEGVSARPASRPDPVSGPSLAPSPAALAPAPMPPAITPPASPMPEPAPAPVPAMSVAVPAEPAPATSPATGRTEGVSARPMARLASRPDPVSGPSLAPSPAALAPAPMPPAIAPPAPPMPEPAPAPAMSAAAPAEPTPSASTAADRAEALRRGDLPRALELSRKHIKGIPARRWTIRLEATSLPTTLKNAVELLPGTESDLFIVPIELRGGMTLNQLFLGDYDSREEAERAAKALPAYFWRGRRRPILFLVSNIPSMACPMARPISTPASIQALKGVSGRSTPSCSQCH